MTAESDAPIAYARLVFLAATAMSASYVAGTELVDHRFGITLALGIILVAAAYLYGEYRGGKRAAELFAWREHHDEVEHDAE